jgi:hypothetical protein
MNKIETLDNASRFMDKVDLRMNGIVVEGTYRSRLFNGFLHLSLEHFGSIILLVRSGMVGSAAALIRPQYEALIRGLYFQDCASDDKVESFINGKDPISLYKMIEALENSFAVENNPLTSIYKGLKNRMHSFTHGGFEQIEKRFSNEELVNSFQDQETVELIQLSNILAIYSATLASAVAGKDDLAKEFVAEINLL